MHSTAPYKECHWGSPWVFQDPASKLWVRAGGTSRGLIVPSNALLVDCTNGEAGAGLFTFKNIKAVLLGRYQKIPRININWPDMGTPTMDQDFWEELIKVWRAHRKTLVVCCMGGHGRTGTSLSILAALTKALPEKETDPVQWIRKVYCDHAVESDKQVKYIELMTGCTVKSSGYKASFSNGADWGWNNTSQQKGHKDKMKFDGDFAGDIDASNNPPLLPKPPLLTKDAPKYLPKNVADIVTSRARKDKKLFHLSEVIDMMSNKELEALTRFDLEDTLDCYNITREESTKIINQFFFLTGENRGSATRKVLKALNQ